MEETRPARTHKPHPKTKFTPEEDEMIRKLVDEIGEDNWQAVAERMPGRNTRQCRERWRNYLSPNVERGPWTKEEDELLQQKYQEYGARWIKIAPFFPQRTDINVKNRWLMLQRHIKKQQRNLEKMAAKKAGKSVNSEQKIVEENTVQAAEVPDQTEFSNFNFNWDEDENPFAPSFEFGRSFDLCDFAW